MSCLSSNNLTLDPKNQIHSAGSSRRAYHSIKNRIVHCVHGSRGPSNIAGVDSSLLLVDRDALDFPVCGVGEEPVNTPQRKRPVGTHKPAGARHRCCARSLRTSPRPCAEHSSVPVRGPRSRTTRRSPSHRFMARTRVRNISRARLRSELTKGSCRRSPSGRGRRSMGCKSSQATGPWADPSHWAAVRRR